MPTPASTRFAALVYNPIKVDARPLRSAVTHSSALAGWDAPLFLETTVEDPGQDVTATAIAAGAAAVLVAGGDGTVRAVSEALAGSGIPLTIVPSGTGNLLARNIQLPLTDVEAAIDTTFSGERLAVDVGRAEVVRPDGNREQHVFVVMAGIGLDAAMIHHTSAMLKKRLGWVAYIDGAARAVTKAQPFRIMYELDSEPLQRARIHSLLWANCGYLPAGIALIPEATINDGILDVAIFQPRRWWEWAAVWRTVWWRNSVLRRTEFGRRVLGRISASGAVRFLKGVALHAAVFEPQPIELDGDAFGDALQMSATIDPGALLVTVPQGHQLRAVDQ